MREQKQFGVEMCGIPVSETYRLLKVTVFNTRYTVLSYWSPYTFPWGTIYLSSCVLLIIFIHQNSTERIRKKESEYSNNKDSLNKDAIQNVLTVIKR